MEIFGLGQTAIPDINEEPNTEAQTTVGLELFPKLTSIKVYDKTPYYMGTRMGRPEKAKERKMKPPVHVLFPFDHDSELQRSMQPVQ